MSEVSIGELATGRRVNREYQPATHDAEPVAARNTAAGRFELKSFRKSVA
jgi:hypothetical protein